VRPRRLRRSGHSRKAHAREATAGSAPNGRGGTFFNCALRTGTVMVMVLVVACVVPGTRLVGEKDADAPAGSPLAESVTALVNGVSDAAERS
jgi:hypothetical protein